MAGLEMWRRDGSVGKVVLAFDVLGEEPGCSDADLKAAYYALARSCHPDKNPGDAGAHGRFIEVQAAYETLTDPENSDTIQSFRNFPEQFKDLVRKCEQNRQIKEQTARALEKAKEEAATRVQAAKEQANQRVQAEQERLQQAQEKLQPVKDALARQEQAEQHEREQREREQLERQQRKRARDAQRKREKRQEEREAREEAVRRQAQRKRQREDRERETMRMQSEHPILLQRVAELESENAALKQQLQQIAALARV